MAWPRPPERRRNRHLQVIFIALLVQLIVFVFGYGQLTEKVEGISLRVERIELYLDRLFR